MASGFALPQRGDPRSRPITSRARGRGRRRGDRWRVVAASVTGTSHRTRQVGCQDAHAVRPLANGTLLIAVADGAGSAKRAAEGAALAVAAALAMLEATPLGAEREHEAGHELMAAAFDAARAAIAAAADVAGVPEGEFQTTLTCVVASDTELICGQIGDGAVVVQDGTGDLFTAIRPERGEYANQTDFVTMDGALDRLQFASHMAPVSAVAVTTDGLLRLGLKLPEYTPHPAFFRPLLAFTAEAADPETARAELAAFLDSDRVCRRTDDDKTLVLAVRRLRSSSAVGMANRNGRGVGP